MGQYTPSFLFFIIVGIIFLIGLWSAKQVQRSRNTWSFYTQGIFDREETVVKYYSRRTGAMVHTTHRYSVKLSTIYLTDGTVLSNLTNCQGLPVEQGAQVKIYKNGLGNFKIEVA